MTDFENKISSILYENIELVILIALFALLFGIVRLFFFSLFRKGKHY